MDYHHGDKDPVFRYAVISDTHLRPRGESSSPWKTNLLTNDRARWAVNKVNTHDPDLVIHLGDIVHPVPHLSTYGSASEVASEIMSYLDAPYFLVPGNHDVGDKNNPTVPSYIINNDYIKDFHNHHGETYQSFDEGNIHFILINGQAINSGLAEEERQKIWLKEDLEKNKGKRIHMFSHYPPYLYTPDEPNNYDNIDQPGREWLLRLIKKYKVEAFFTGHIHQFFHKKYGDTDIWNLLSTCNLRQDYSNLFRVEAIEEYGRNDTAKLGYCIVEVYDESYVSRIHRSYGQTLKKGEKLQTPKKIRTYFTYETPLSPLGVQIRYPLAEVTELPYMGPVDEFVRKKARNDYTALGLWETGIKTVRLPLSDLLDDTTRQRINELQLMGNRFGFFTVNTPSPDKIEEYLKLVSFLEVILPWKTAHETIQEASKLRDDLNIPVYMGNIESSVHRKRIGSKYSHYMSHGFHVDDWQNYETIIKHKGSVDGFIFEVGESENPLPTIINVHKLSASNDFKALVNVRLAPEDPAHYPRDHTHIANRTAEATIAGYTFQDIIILMDTFMDHDRGYFPRAGLYDRRLNPRPAALVYRHLNSTVNTYGSNIIETKRCDVKDETIIYFRTPQIEYRLHLPNTMELKKPETNNIIIDLLTGKINPRKISKATPFLEVKRG